MKDMLGWVGKNVSSIAWKLVLTLACCVTLQNIIKSEGYRCSLSTIIVAAACIIVVTRAWAPSREWE